MSIATNDCGRAKDAATIERRLRNPHPGEILNEEFLAEIGMSQNQLAHVIGVPGNRIHAIVNGSRDITADTAGSLHRLPKSSPTRRPEDPVGFPRCLRVRANLPPCSADLIPCSVA